ncbi:hypothetical protein [Enterobacter phage 02_vB_Eclo_IJM]|nr:hypothetical protein [Enterobacter phage 02_vB_Eclo_IJM]
MAKVLMDRGWEPTSSRRPGSRSVMTKRWNTLS